MIIFKNLFLIFKNIFKKILPRRNFHNTVVPSGKNHQSTDIFSRLKIPRLFKTNHKN